MKQLILLAALSVSFSAFATNNGNGNSNNSTNTTNAPVAIGQGGNASAGAAALAGAASSSNATGGQGGAGGKGGEGGSAAVVGSGNSSNRNDVKSTNIQGQGQAQSSSNRNNLAASSGGNTMQGGAVTVQGDTYQAQERAPVATAYAAPLTSSNGTCMGSSSGGVQGGGLGVSIGSTWTDSGCDARYDAEALRAAGLASVAIARLCQKPEIAKAMEAAGNTCPGTKKAAAAPAVAAPATVEEKKAGYTGQDPIIRKRLGLPL